jgi:hemerythrin
MTKIEWGPKYETGNQIIDNQHRGLIDLINDLNLLASKLKAGKTQHTREMEDIVSDLSTYCKNHFSTEETIMKDMHYPKFAAHHKLHEAFTSKIDEFQKRFFDEETDVSDQLCEYLNNWLFTHIAKEDMSFFKK